MKKIWSLVLACVLSAAMFVGLTGCGDKDDKKGNNTVMNELEIGEGIHIDNTTPGSEFIISQGADTEYVIAISATATNNEMKAAGVVQNFFLEATGQTLDIKDETTLSSSDKVISVGNTQRGLSAGVAFDASELTDSGFVIKTVGDGVYINGGNNGICYAAYELLNRLFGMEYYAEYCYFIEKNVTQLKLQNFDIKERPDFEFRNPAMGYITRTDDAYLRDAWKLSSGGVMYNYGAQHNTFMFLPPATYKEEHPLWYSPNEDGWKPGQGIPAQLCYTRDIDGLTDEFMKKFKEVVLANPNYEIFSIVNQDNVDWCECDSCKALAAQYTVDPNKPVETAGYIRFLNKVAMRINEDEDVKATGRTIRICGMAYHRTENAPSKYDEATGKYVPMDETVKLDSRVCMQYAPRNADYYVAFDEWGRLGRNVPYYENLQMWSAITNEMLLWTYNQNFQCYMGMYDNFNSMQRNYQLMYKYNGMYIFDQGQWDNRNATAWNVLKGYLSSKLAWNVRVDYQALIDGFFDNYFGAASDVMKEVFYDTRAHYAYKYSNGKLDGARQAVNTTDFWPSNLLDSMLAKIDSAYAAIEPLKASDGVLYEKIKDRITLESISYRYMRLELYVTLYTDGELAKERLAFKNDCIKVRVSLEKEVKSVDLLWERWGI
jgi:hypothetical protein